MIRGRVQIEWRCTNQVRAGTQRDWLNLQLEGRGYVDEQLPVARNKLTQGVWLTLMNVAFDTLAAGQIVKQLCETRQAADPFILAGSWTKYHECPHEDGTNDCQSTLVKTVK